MQSFPFSLANNHPVKMCSYHGFFLTNLGSLDVKFGFVGKESNKRRSIFLLGNVLTRLVVLKCSLQPTLCLGVLMLLFWGFPLKYIGREELRNGLP